MRGFKDSTKTKYSTGGAVARGNRAQALEAREEAKLLRETPRSAPRKAAREAVKVAPDPREPVVRTPLMDRLSVVPSKRGEMPIRRKCGGLTVKK